MPSSQLGGPADWDKRESSSHTTLIDQIADQVSTPPENAMSELALGYLMHDGAFHERPDAGQSRSVVLLLALRAEVMRISVLTAICATAANIVRNEPDTRAARALTRFFPVGSSDFILASARFRRLAPGSITAIAIDAFYEALSKATCATLMFTASRQEASQFTTISAVDLAAAWRAACTQAHALLIELDLGLAKAIGTDIPNIKADNGDRLIVALKEAAGGGLPFRDADGEIVMPSWVEQRHSPRVDVAFLASIIVGSGTKPIRISDLSSGGLGVETSEALEEGNLVTIKVSDIVIPGRVIWCRHGRAGIAFEHAILDDSPEYRFLRNHVQAP